MIYPVHSNSGSFLFRRSKSEARWMISLEYLFSSTSLLTRQIITISHSTSQQGQQEASLRLPTYMTPLRTLCGFLITITHIPQL